MSQLESERHFSRLSAERTTFPLLPVHQPHTWSASPSISDPQAGHSPSSTSDASSEANGEDDNAGSQKGKRRRLGLNEAEDSTGKTRNPRKTAVACNFCRGTILTCGWEQTPYSAWTGRKLRCNGAKPSCSNCLVRNFRCEYVPVQRRRGPGKAPKGTKSKKTAYHFPETSAGLKPLGSQPHGESAPGSLPSTSPNDYQMSTFVAFQSDMSSAPSSHRRRRHRSSPSPETGSDGKET